MQCKVCGKSIEDGSEIIVTTAAGDRETVCGAKCAAQVKGITAVSGDTRPPRKPRSDKGKPRKVVYMVTRKSDATGGHELMPLFEIGRGATIEDVMDAAAKQVASGHEVELWRQVGKPLTAQLRFA